jgi:indolepyruvate ferredoxin oxidoreductase beta subunit
MPTYPELNDILNEIKKVPNNLALDADTIAEEIGSARSSNMVVLGAASPFLNMSFESLEEGVKNLFAKKGEAIINSNLKALQAGRAFAEKNR